MRRLVTILSILGLIVGAGLHLNVALSSNQGPVIEHFRVNSVTPKKPPLSYDFEVMACSSLGQIEATIDFGDSRTTRFSLECGTLKNVLHTYSRSGEYEVALSVRDRQGRRQERSFSFEVREEPPLIDIFEINSSSNTRVDGLVLFDVKICALDDREVDTTLRFGDGQSASVPTTCGAQSISHRYSTAGNFAAVLTAKNLSGFRSQKTLAVSINGAPTPPPPPPGNLRGRTVRIQDDLDELWYITRSGQRRRVLSEQVFLSYPGNETGDIIIISRSRLEDFPLNRLIRWLDDNRIFLLDGGQKRWIATQAALNRLGLHRELVAPVNLTEFASWPTGSAIW